MGVQNAAGVFGTCWRLPFSLRFGITFWPRVGRRWITFWLRVGNVLVPFWGPTQSVTHNTFGRNVFNTFSTRVQYVFGLAPARLHMLCSWQHSAWKICPQKYLSIDNVPSNSCVNRVHVVFITFSIRFQDVLVTFCAAPLEFMVVAPAGQTQSECPQPLSKRFLVD